MLPAPSPAQDARRPTDEARVTRIGCAISVLLVFGIFAAIGFYDMVGTATGRFPYVHNSWTTDAIGFLPAALVVEAIAISAAIALSVTRRTWLPLVIAVALLGIVNLAGEVFFHGIPVY